MLRGWARYTLVYLIRNYLKIHQETILANPDTQSSFKIILRISNSYSLNNNEFMSGDNCKEKSIRSAKNSHVYPEIFYTL